MLTSGLAVDFEPHFPGQHDGLHGLIALSENWELLREAIASGLSCYQVHSAEPASFSRPAAIRFTSSASIDAAFQNQELTDASVVKLCHVPELSDSLAQVDGNPVWSIDQTNGREVHHVGMELPAFGTNDFFHAHFRASRWFAMVPLLHYLRQLLGPEGWPRPEPRATFIVDDPNLHHRSYGYINFEVLAAHSTTHNYHATIATVPLDAWYFNSSVAALFRKHKQRISMMMHGVNHVADELAREYTEEQAFALLAAGLRRITAFEDRSGLKVDRVMAAPHGAFTEAIADPMVRLGYEAGCVSVGSLVHWNPGKKWPADLGLSIAQILGHHGFPVFHRTSTNQCDVRLSAFLGHPIVIATHHQDYVSNFARIESLANMVNHISSPRWMTIENISRTNYVSSVSEGVLRVRPYSRRVTVTIPQGIAVLQLLPSHFGEETTIDLNKLFQDGGRNAQNTALFTCNISNNVAEMYFPPVDPVDYRKAGRLRIGLWPITRRLLAEGRDRVRPMLSFGQHGD
jgi:hypothetical protein